MHSSLAIRPAAHTDCCDIAVINREVLIATYADVSPEITEEALRYHTGGDWLANKTAFYEDRLREGCQLPIAKIGNKAVGFAMAGTDYALYVLPEYQGSTVGLRLIDSLAATATGDIPVERITFTVVLGTSAIRFYERVGCRPTGRDVTAELPVLRGGQVLPQIEMELTMSAARRAQERITALLARRQS